jgi:polyferredoxin
MGIDIRNGPQLECIQCALCIDACDEIMDKVERPRKLIAYDTYRNLQAEAHGDLAKPRIARPRTLLYASAFLLVGALMLFGLSQKTVLDVNVVPDRNPLFVQVSGGGIRNGYTVRILNKQHETRTFTIAVSGLEQARLSYAGAESAHAVIEVKPDDVRSVKLYVTVPGEEAEELPASAAIAIAVRDTANGAETIRKTNFRGPGH